MRPHSRHLASVRCIGPYLPTLKPLSPNERMPTDLRKTMCQDLSAPQSPPAHPRNLIVFPGAHNLSFRIIIQRKEYLFKSVMEGENGLYADMRTCFVLGYSLAGACQKRSEGCRCEDFFCRADSTVLKPERKRLKFFSKIGNRT